MAPSIGNLMQGAARVLCDTKVKSSSLTQATLAELLKLSNEVDLDALAETFRKLVDDFQDELVPYTEQLMGSLAQTYLRILTETVENDKRDDATSLLDEKVLTGAPSPHPEALATPPEQVDLT